MHRPRTAEAAVGEELAAVRPGLLPRYAAELPGARASVLTRLWRALVHEPLPFITARERVRDGLVLRLGDGRTLSGPPSDPYATSAGVTEVWLDGTAYDDPARLTAALSVPHGDAFAAELAHCVASLALSRADQPAGDAGRAPATDWEWEQRVVDGHPYHPACRSRPGFSVAEQLAYGPEHRPVVRLGLLPVPARECLVTGQWPEHLRDGERLLVPVHPWQAGHVLARPATAGVLPAHPLMSLRTLALPDGGPHVKTALSARLTSSVRDISVGSVAASQTLSAFMAELAARTDGLLHITRTLGAVTAHCPDLAALWRESPRVCAEPGEQVLPVAALARTGLPRSPGWLTAFTRLALTAGLRMLQLGVALEAHGQNLLVVLSEAGTPRRLVYRDVADVRVSPARLARHGIPVPDLPARNLTDDPVALRRKLFGSLVAGALASTAGSAPALAAALEPVLRELPDDGDCLALRQTSIPAKALTLMRLSPDRPGDRWTRLPHPLTADQLVLMPDPADQ
ncbi:IucA/IucC family protein [Streptomyces thermodiastaticus]|uniref:IucA/IucC family protein n=1 Tax=Streptomyces thermodiastaticus TaxID=44061 RepID=UPI001674B6FB|nr:IucA/IucC family siderophore biosynthesis protein [Streptomyces thermodiastaticus]MCE7549108.1 IucA/IucC family siderophore biosynthesis protein [Streptomyces thermodiastaticus]GHF60198.1 iron transporter [Streptomyces thermodiastaticus]